MGKPGTRVNVGAPVSPAEIDGYIRALAKAAPGMSRFEQLRLRQGLHDVVGRLVSDTGDIEVPTVPSYANYLAKGDLTGALRAVDHILALAPTAAYPHGYRGRVLCAMEQWHEAANEFQRNSGLFRPDIDEHFWQMMCALVPAGDRDEYHRRLQSVVEPDWELPSTDALKLELHRLRNRAGYAEPTRRCSIYSAPVRRLACRSDPVGGGSVFCLGAG